MPDHPCVQSAEIGAVFVGFSQLSELVNQTSYQQHLPTDKFKTADIYQIYISYLAWYDGTPELGQVGKYSTPAVLFLQYVYFYIWYLPSKADKTTLSMYFQFAILTLLWPVVEVKVEVDNDIFPTPPGHLCWEVATAIQRLTKTFSQLFTLRRAPAFVSHMLGTACCALITMSRSSTDNSNAMVPVTTGAAPDDFPLVVSYSIESLAEMAKTQRGAQQELAKVEHLINME